MNSSVIRQKPSQGAEAWRSLFLFLFMCEDMREKSGVEFSVSDNGLKTRTIFGFFLAIRENLRNYCFLILIPVFSSILSLSDLNWEKKECSGLAALYVNFLYGLDP
jgi:hypothetical protein